MKGRYIKGILAGCAFALLIADTKTAVAGVQDGVSMCIQTVIPSLLPFLILSKYLTRQLTGVRIPFMKRLGYLCGLPSGMESVFTMGLLGGYPVGAQLIADAWLNNQIDQDNATRMLGFCNNAGPAFIFGVCVPLFKTPGAGWFIYLIQVLSAIFAGIVLPRKMTSNPGKVLTNPVSFVKTLEFAMHGMLNICSWIVCFRVIIAYFDAYFQIDNGFLMAVLLGLMELVNGCIALKELDSEQIRFILINGMLSLGGLCIWMQTAASVKGLSLKWFYVGKGVQCVCSIFLSMLIQSFIFESSIPVHIGFVVLGIVCLIGVLARKKVVAFCLKVLYDNREKRNTRWQNAVSQKH